MIEILNIQDTEEYRGFELIYGYYDILAKLPDNATNGDMIKAMFPNIEIEGIGGEIKCIAGQIGFGTSYFALDWWNAPYKGGRE